MYNGIGLQTVRGSGTSGYVQTNKFNIRRLPDRRVLQSESADGPGPGQQQPNKAILDHNRKRELELQVLKERDRLEEAGDLTSAEVEAKLTEFRELLEAQAQTAAVAVQPRNEKETHWLAEKKQEELARVREAWGLADSKEGDAFNHEVQEAKKQARIAEREKKRQEAEDRQAQKEKDKKRKEKEAKKAAKLREKEEAERQKKKQAEARKAAEAAARPKAVPAAERYIPRPATPPQHDMSSDAERSLTPSPSPTKAEVDGPVEPPPPRAVPKRIAAERAPSPAPRKRARVSRSASPPPRRTSRDEVAAHRRADEHHLHGHDRDRDQDRRGDRHGDRHRDRGRDRGYDRSDWERDRHRDQYRSSGYDRDDRRHNSRRSEERNRDRPVSAAEAPRAGRTDQLRRDRNDQARPGSRRDDERPAQQTRPSGTADLDRAKPRDTAAIAVNGRSKKNRSPSPSGSSSSGSSSTDSSSSGSSSNSSSSSSGSGSFSSGSVSDSSRD